MGPLRDYKHDMYERCVYSRKVGVPMLRRPATDPLDLVVCPSSITIGSRDSELQLKHIRKAKRQLRMQTDQQLGNLRYVKKNREASQREEWKEE